MGVSRSGYYKWKKRDKSTRDLKREEVIALVSEVHKAHPSHGYRWVAAFIRVNYPQDISDNYVYKAFRFLGIKAKTKHQVHYRPRKIRDLYPNLIFTTWDTVDRPRQVVVSDMTVLKPWIFYLELTLYFDVFTKQILTWKLSERRGGREQYLDGLADVVELLRGKKEPTIIHTDQGSVYSSKAYNELIQDSNIVRSMSRAGKPTDNPVNEALNGWIKEELFIDFRLEECRTRDAAKDVLCRYVDFYNRQRPCFAIGYDTPDNYCKRFYRGELEKKDSSALGGKVSYYHDRLDLEADCVLHLSDGRYALIEFKLGSREIEEGAQHLLEIKKLIRRAIENGATSLREPDLLMVITGGEIAYTRPDGVKIIPIGCLKD